MFKATVLTLYPDMFPGHLGLSMAGRALADGLWQIETVQIRDFADGKPVSYTHLTLPTSDLV